MSNANISCRVHITTKWNYHCQGCHEPFHDGGMAVTSKGLFDKWFVTAKN